jgi:hypothetical protein
MGKSNFKNIFDYDSFNLTKIILNMHMILGLDFCLFIVMVGMTGVLFSYVKYRK